MYSQHMLIMKQLSWYRHMTFIGGAVCLWVRNLIPMPKAALVSKHTCYIGFIISRSIEK